MNQETAAKIIDKAKDIFNTSAVKTLGDVADHMQFAGRENLPEDVRNHSLSPDAIFSMPDDYFCVMQEAGFEVEAAHTLIKTATDIRRGQMRQAYATILKPE